MLIHIPRKFIYIKKKKSISNKKNEIIYIHEKKKKKKDQNIQYLFKTILHEINDLSMPLWNIYSLEHHDLPSFL